MNKELLEKAKKTKSVDDLVVLSRANGISLTREEADSYFESLHKSGEITDDELDSVSGGCNTTVDGMTYTVVSSGCKCFTGEFSKIGERDTWLREKWYMYAADGELCCGNCVNLMFKNGLGYCSKSGR